MEEDGLSIYNNNFKITDMKKMMKPMVTKGSVGKSSTMNGTPMQAKKNCGMGKGMMKKY